MNIYLWDIKRNLKSVVIWTVVLIAILFMYGAFYPSMAKDAELLSKVMKLMPKAFLRIFGLENFDFTNILNYLATISSIFVTLFGSIFASLLAIKMIAKEESDRTAEFLLSKPIKRSKILWQKILILLSSVLFLDATLCLFSLMIMEYFGSGTFDHKKFLVFWFSQFILHISIADLVFCVTTCLKRQDNSISLAIGIVFVLYILSMVSKLTDQARFLGYFTPFYYSDGIKVVKEGFIEPIFLLLYLLINSAAILISFLIYSKKDIYL
ncbi:ABC transporter permease subunit [Thermotoga profunda]|uniref:ABC transporter permease subunit n=1 Tax=Thermotoga profunda TaxID=1508420 RepID=UPI0005978B4D|nr:ABC transporter permease subunit [Thermotoga profunda]